MTTSACPLASLGSTVPWPRTPTFNGREIRASAEPGTTDRETRPRPRPGGAAEALTPCAGGAASRRPPGGVLLALRSGPVERARGTPGSGDGARCRGRRARTGRERHTRVSHTRACAHVCTRAHTGPHPMSEGYFRVLRSHAQRVTATGDGDRVCVACVSGSASTDHADSSGRRAPPGGHFSRHLPPPRLCLWKDRGTQRWPVALSPAQKVTAGARELSRLARRWRGRVRHPLPAPVGPQTRPASSAPAPPASTAPVP